MNERIKVIVMSRLEAYQYCKNYHDKPSAIISISTPYSIYDYCVFKSEENQVIDILELSFVDADEPESLDVNDIIAAEKDLLCDKDAERIVEFSEKYKDKLLIKYSGTIPGTTQKYLIIIPMIRICGAILKL